MAAKEQELAAIKQRKNKILDAFGAFNDIDEDDADGDGDNERDKTYDAARVNPNASVDGNRFNRSVGIASPARSVGSNAGLGKMAGAF